MERHLKCWCCFKHTANWINTGTNSNPSWRVLCQPCWKDPALRYTDCKHGEPDHA